MADSTDGLLKYIRACSAQYRRDGTFSANVVETFERIDALLSAGGPLPAAWADCAPVVNVVSHIPDIVDLPDGDQVFAPPPRTALVRKLAEKDAEIDRLTAELDATRNVPVEYVITAGLEAAMAADPDRADGTVLRTTDGKRQAWAWKAATREWERMQ